MNKLMMNGLLAVISMVTVVSCGGGGSSSNNNTAQQTAVTPGSCQAGTVWYQNGQFTGCIPQNNCGVGYGWYNNQCVQGTPYAGYNNGYNNGGGNCVNNYCGNNSGYYYVPSFNNWYPQGNCTYGSAWVNSTCIPCNTYMPPYSTYNSYSNRFGAQWYWIWYKREGKQHHSGKVLPPMQ